MSDTLEFKTVSFPCRPPEEVAVSHGYRIRVLKDTCPVNPWEDWDGQPPLVATDIADRLRFEYGDPFGALLAGCSDRFLREQLQPVAAAFAIDLSYFSPDSHGQERFVREALRECYEREPVKTLEALCRLLGVPFHAWESLGYAQGDRLDCILVATPAWVEETGLSQVFISGALAGDAGLFDAYLWGDVFAFILENPAGQEIDACGGYYGDFFASGLVTDAVSAIDADLERCRREAAALAATPLQTA